MGYLTQYAGEVDGPEPWISDFTSNPEQPLLAQDNFILRDFFMGEVYDSMKWYSWKTDLKTISYAWPHLLFSLHGEGEENGDIWKAYARNGRVIEVKAKISFDIPDLDTALPPPVVDQAKVTKLLNRAKEIEDTLSELKNEYKSVIEAAAKL